MEKQTNNTLSNNLCTKHKLEKNCSVKKWINADTSEKLRDDNSANLQTDFVVIVSKSRSKVWTPQAAPDLGDNGIFKPG